MKTKFWRQWHRWIGFPAAIFLVFAAITGVIVAATEFFGPAEAEREALRDVISSVTTSSEPSAWSAPVARAVQSAAATAPGAPIDKILVKLKGPAPTVTVFLGKPAGGEDRSLVFNANTGALLATESYVDKPFLYRLHSGEWFGDGGLVLAMFWGLALAIMAISGLIVYWTMKPRKVVEGLRRVFW